ncbi:MAG: metalloregulator ArsR/SmtB family transcription factor [Candidatus Nanopelagicales bacterium]
MDRETALEIHDLHARLCKAIADPKRLLIINELRNGPMTVGELADALGMGQPNTSQHLAVLRERSVVQAERSGPHTFYSLNGDKVVQAIDLLRQFMAEELGSASKLGRVAARTPPAMSQL